MGRKNSVINKVLLETRWPQAFRVYGFDGQKELQISTNI